MANISNTAKADTQAYSQTGRLNSECERVWAKDFMMRRLA